MSKKANLHKSARIAVFTAPKPFEDPRISIIQQNAIRSWMAIGDTIEVWLVGNESGVEQAAAETGVNYLPDVARNAYGTPRIDSMFNLVRTNSKADFLCYVNADILLFPDLVTTVEMVKQSHERFLLVGQRWDMEIDQILPIEPGWHETFLENFQDRSSLHAPSGSDYFVFPRSGFIDIPPFAIGRAGWDNWMIFKGRLERMAVIDSTKAITAIHQNHDFSHLPGGKIHRDQPESLENLKLAGGRERIFTLLDANRAITGGRITRPARSREKFTREVSITPLLHLKPDDWPTLCIG